jgi:phosphatidylinositol kinase/protein kinase (PI-3  family)
VKDRHNGNILLDSKGHLVHIDFGFMLQSAPGGINFESVPFKLTQEYLDIMGGTNSEIFDYFKSLLIKGLLELRKHLEDILTIIEICMKGSQMPCFVKPDTLFSEIRNRISLKYNVSTKTDSEGYFELVDRIVKGSANAWRTYQYDTFQKMTNGIER